MNGIKGIFIPDTDELKNDVNGLLEQLNHTFNLGIDSQNWLVDSFTEEAIPNEEATYNIPGLGEIKLTFFDASYLKRGIEYFRPIIRGFIVLLLVFFNYKQVLTLIGQDPGMYHSAKIKSEGGKGE